MPVTQKIIADHLGLARSVVAEALSGHPRIAEHTRERVRIAARELGYDYTSNREARALISRRYNRRAKSGIVAVLSPAASGPFTESMAAYYRPLMDGATLAAHECGLSLLLCSHEAQSVPNVVVDGTVDGVIVLGAASDAIRDQLTKLRVPIVSVGVDRQWDGASILMPDFVDGGRQAARHLVSLGHARIAYLGHYAETDWQVPRLTGLQNGMGDAGLSIDPIHIETSIFGATFENITGGLGRLLDRSRDFTALFCHNDTFAMHAIQALRERGLHVPRDISVVGFDDTSSTVGYTPAITSIHSPRLDMGRRSVELITAGPTESPIEELFPVQLVVRGFTLNIGLMLARND